MRESFAQLPILFNWRVCSTFMFQQVLHSSLVAAAVVVVFFFSFRPFVQSFCLPVLLFRVSADIFFSNIGEMPIAYIC